MSGHRHAPSLASCSGPDNEVPGRTENFDNFYTPQNKSFYDRAPYKPLRKQPREIRLVSLSLDQRGQDHLELRLYDNVPLDKAGDFYALSYAAGDHHQTEVIRIRFGDSGKAVSFNAFRNLAKALRAVRDFEDPAAPLSAAGNSELRFWVDQMCINQSDPDERADQVSRMRKIYQAASTTIVYLGEDPHEGRAISYLRKTSKYCNLAAPDLPPAYRGAALERASRWMVGHVTNSDDLENWNALYSLLGQPWWERGWVCQEAIVSRNPVVLYGSLSLDFDSLATALQAFAMAQTQLFTHLVELTYGLYMHSPMYQHLANLTTGVNLSHAEFIVHSWMASSECAVQGNDRSYLPMQLLLRQARTCKTGDPRDRVYAFIGLADPAYGIVPNYKQTVTEVFTNAAARILVKEQDYSIIFHAMENVPQRTPNLPTWVADWTCPPQRRRYLFRAESFSASAGCEGRFGFPEARNGSFCGPILRIQVLRFDKLSMPELFVCVGSETSEEKVIIMLRQWRSRSEQHLRSTEYSDLYSWGGGRSDAFRQAIKFGGASSIHEDSTLSNPTGLKQQPVTPENVLQGYLDMQRGLDRQWPFFTTPIGFMGRASPGARHDDDLVLALGASVPMILRKVEGRGCYTFVGEAYVHGMMKGEAIKLMEKGNLQVEEVDII